jgi:Uma2 family endonuclease
VTTLTAPITELPPTFRPLRREEYVKLYELGVFGEARVELVGGVLIEMAPVKPPHAWAVLRLTKTLVLQAGDRYWVSCQGPIELDPISQPLPDFMVLPPEDYSESNPAKALLIIEVAESSLRFDLGEKARRYAMAGTPLYWVVDVINRVVHVHTDPHKDGSWGSIRPVQDGELDAEDLGLTVDVTDLLDF